MIIPPGALDCSDWTYDCSVSGMFLGTSIAVDVFGIVYFLVYMYIIRLAIWALKMRPYHDNKLVCSSIPSFDYWTLWD